MLSESTNHWYIKRGLDTAHGAESEVSQTQLVDGLRRLHRMTDDASLKSRIQDQINYVSYSLPHPSKLDGTALSQALNTIESTDEQSLEYSLNEINRHLRNAHK